MVRTLMTLFGGFEVRLRAGASLVLPTHQYRALLAFLAVPPGRAHPREKLVALLWDDLPADRGRSALRQAVFAIRKALDADGPSALLVTGDTVALDPEIVSVDVAEFERLAGKNRLASLERAAALYRGDFLAGLPLVGGLFEDWLTSERERLRERAIEILARLLAAQRRAGAPEAATQTALRLLALDPLQEPVHRALMRLYVEQGRRAAALKQYQGCLAVLQRELAAEPEEETRALYQEILRRRPSPEETSGRGPSDNSVPFTTRRRQASALATDTPLVGRDREMVRMRAWLAEAAGGQGHLVAVVGEAGVGKTRLAAELAAEADAKGARVLVGRGHESEQILPFGPWVDALGSGQVLADGAWMETLPLVTRRELGRLWPEHGPQEGESSGPPDYLKLFAGIGLLIQHLADRQPTVLILEDLHWADEMSVRLLAFLGRRLSPWRLLLLVTARAEDLADAPMLQRTLCELEREPDVATVPLGPLSRDDTLDLVRILSGPGRAEAVAARLREHVWRASGGNPFVVIEAMRAAAHDALSPDLERLPLPERVRDLVGRQLDRVDERHRELVALASVVGREFEFSLLQHVSGLGEDETARGVEELIRRRVLHTVGERLDFTHDRVREVAYSRILGPRRRAFHRRVAEALTTLHATELGSHHLALGRHYAEAEVWEQAAVHLRRAGRRAVERSANREAAACFESALTALAHLPDSRDTREQALEVRLDLQLLLRQLGETRRALERLREARALAEQLGDDRRLGWVFASMTGDHVQLGELDDALVSGTRALATAQALEDVPLRMAATNYLAQAHFMRGEYDCVVELATGNLAAAEADLGFYAPYRRVGSLLWLLMSLAHLGRFAQGEAHAAEAMQMVQLAPQPLNVVVAFGAAGTLRLFKGDWAAARSPLEHCVAVARAESIVQHLPWVVSASALMLAQLDDKDEALKRFREGEQLLEHHAVQGNVRILAYVPLLLGRTAWVLGRLHEARHLARRTLEFSSSQPGFTVHALHLLGDVATHPDRFDAEGGEAHYRQALALAEPRCMRPLVAHCHLGLGTLYRRTDRREQAREHLAIATALYQEMDMGFWLEQAQGEMRAWDFSARVGMTGPCGPA